MMTEYDFMKKISFNILISVGFFCVPVIASLAPINEEKELAWDFYGHFNDTFDYSSNSPVNRQFKVKCLHGYIKEIDCLGYKDGRFRIVITFFKEFLSTFYQNNIFFWSDIKHEGGIDAYLRHMYWAFPGRETRFLKVLYSYGLIPGFVLDRIFSETGLLDFRSNLLLHQNSSRF